MNILAALKREEAKFEKQVKYGAATVGYCSCGNEALRRYEWER
jgi:hypothetical protein